MKTDMRRKTAGEVAFDLKMKQPDILTVQDLSDEANKTYIPTLLQTAKDGKDKYPGDFFIEVLTKKEKWTDNVLRNYFTHRISCPTPFYDSTVFMFHAATDDIEYLWTIPCQEGCAWLLQNINNCHEENRQATSMVVDFKNGTLHELCKKLNKENPNVVQYGISKVEGTV